MEKVIRKYLGELKTGCKTMNRRIFLRKSVVALSGIAVFPQTLFLEKLLVSGRNNPKNSVCELIRVCWENPPNNENQTEDRTDNMGIFPDVNSAVTAFKKDYCNVNMEKYYSLEYQLYLFSKNPNKSGAKCLSVTDIEVVNIETGTTSVKHYDLLNDPIHKFRGTRPEDCLFKEGEFVKIPTNKQSNWGIVCCTPCLPEWIQTEIDASHRGIWVNRYDAHCYNVDYVNDNAVIKSSEFTEDVLLRPDEKINEKTKQKLLGNYHHSKCSFERFYCVEDKMIIEISTHHMSKIDAPHCIIFPGNCQFYYDIVSHPVVLLNNLEVVKGDAKLLKQKEYEKAVEYLKNKKDELIKSFNKMKKLNGIGRA